MRPRPRWRRAPASAVPAGLAFALLPVLLSSWGSAETRAAGAGSTAPSARGPSAGTPDLTLATSAYPSTICVGGSNDCPAGIGVAHVALTAAFSAPPVQVYPNVQIVFVLDTTLYDGDFGTDSVGLDPCAQQAGSPACEESNAIPFFVANAGRIAAGIASSNPHSSVSFALVDYYDSWGSDWDDEDGPEYHVDIGQFVPAASFGPDVVDTFQAEVLAGGWYAWDQDMDNNFLDSSSITALYGAIVGSDLDWSPGAHHVIVWIGITAPRAPGYQQNYCVSPSSWNQWGRPANCYSQTCEPSYVFPTGAEPECEGWTTSQNGNATDSIAGLARTAPPCVDSAGGSCVIDIIDNWGTPTDPYSRSWPTDAGPGGGPGGTLVWQNVERVLSAGCAMAEATGGTWDGPSWFSCPNGDTGSLAYVNHGPIRTPNTENPTLYEALAHIGFGPLEAPVTADATDHPLFLFVPAAGVSVAADPDWTTNCATPNGPSPDCPIVPTVVETNGVPAYGWNWSSIPVDNFLASGDAWTAQFDIIARGPTTGLVPVDACTLAPCLTAGGGMRSGTYTWVDYVLNRSGVGGPPIETRQSFPLTELHLELAPAGAPPPPNPPAAPTTPPAGGLPVEVPAAVPNPVAVLLSTPTSVVQTQAVAAGFLAAGFTRVGLKNRPVAVSVAVHTPGGTRRSTRSRFE